MPEPVAYEPSVEAILAGALPLGSKLLAGKTGLRRRVSWTRLARATGLGALEGGEMILASTDHAAALLGRLGDLATAGVAAIALVAPTLPDELALSQLPVIALPPDADPRKLQGEVERFIARRRRELFQLQQELHRSLVDAALGGAGLKTLVETAAARSGRPAAVDRSGITDLAGEAAGAVSEGLLAEARIACHDQNGPVSITGPPPSLAVEIRGGRERYGLALIAGVDASSRDDAEAVLSALASAGAISLARAPAHIIPTVADILADWVSLERIRARPEAGLIVLALRDATGSAAEIERAVVAELRLRSIPHIAAADGAELVVFADAGSAPIWDSILEGASRRLGSRALAAGMGRERRSLDHIDAACEEAREALRHASGSGVTRFESVELRALLAGDPGWQTFARSRLAPLLGGKPADGELLRTLRVYLDAGQNAKEAALVLHVHRNTLLYRLRRLSQVLGVDLNDANRLFELDLASRIVGDGAPE